MHNAWFVVGIVVLILLMGTWLYQLIVTKSVLKKKTVTVEGNAFVTTKPNVAHIEIGNEGETDMMQQVVNKLQQQFSFLTPKHFVTTEYTVKPFDKEEKVTVIKNKITHRIQIRLDTPESFTNLSQIVNLAKSNGANLIGSLQFSLNHETQETANRLALQKAMVNAHEKAFSIAKSASLTLGSVLTVNSSSSMFGQASRSFNEQIDTNVQVPEEEKVFANVTVTYDMY